MKRNLLAPSVQSSRERLERHRLLRSVGTGLALALLIILCAFRVSALRVLPLDAPGTLRPLLYNYLQRYESFFPNTRSAFVFWHSACYLVLISVPTLAFASLLYRRKINSRPSGFVGVMFSRWTFWAWYGLCLLLCRYPVLLQNELNPDEGQFLTSACKLFYDPNFFHSVDCHTSGPGNVFPLMASAIFGLSPDFAASRLVALCAIFCSVYLLYRAASLICPEDLARIAIVPIAIAFPVLIHTEFIYSSSEHIPILLVALSLLLSVQILIRPGHHRVQAFLLGLTASAAFFTKIQAVPIIAVQATVPVVFLLVRSYGRATLRALIWIAIGALPPVVLNTVLCLRAGVWRDFWHSYVISNLDYANPRTTFWQHVHWFLPWALETREFRSFFLAAAIIALACLCQKPDPDRKSDRVGWFGLLAGLSFASATFSIYKANRPFLHYLLLLFVPTGMLLVWLLRRAKEGSNLLPQVVLVISAIFATYLWSYQDPHSFEVPDMIRGPEGDLIRTLTSPQARIYVWGWTARPYLASGRMPATRQTLVGTLFREYDVTSRPPSYDPTPASRRVTAFYRDRELRDLRSNPPELFIDAIGPASWFLYDRRYYGFERIPEIAAFVNANYIHVADLYGERFFLKRDVAAQREAEISRPLPTRSCSPGSLICLDKPISLPHELAAVDMPLRARIEVSFLPIRAQVGVATVINNEAQPNSFRGYRLQHIRDDRYILLIGVGDGWAFSNPFLLPAGQPAFIAIDFDERNVRISNNGSLIQEFSLPRPMVDAHGPISLGSWIRGMAPFSGKIQFFEIVGL